MVRLFLESQDLVTKLTRRESKIIKGLLVIFSESYSMRTQTIQCHYCDTSFKKPRQHDSNRKRSPNISHSFCSSKCFNMHHTQIGNVTQPCGWCQKPVVRNKKELKKSRSGLLFCNRSCAASYNNTKKRKSRRSKCEAMLCSLLVEEFPDLEILPNDKKILDGFEIDIAIPSLHLGIEWNGIVHFKPIYAHLWQGST